MKLLSTKSEGQYSIRGVVFGVQEVMGSLHNLFGATAVVEVEAVKAVPGSETEIRISNVCVGQTVEEVLRAVQVCWGMGVGLGFGV